MMKPLPIILIAVLLLAFIPACNADTENVTVGRTVTMKGNTNITISLGFENFVPMEQARVYYNWISVGFLVMLGATASYRTTRFFAILLPGFAAMFAWFGWFLYTDPAHPEQLWGLIIVAVIIGVAVYMKGSLHEAFGIAGPGSSFFNLVFFILILESVVGFVNYTQIWDFNAAPSENSSYTNIDLTSEVSTINAKGGLEGGIANIATIISAMTLGVLNMFISMGLAICAFSLVLGIIFPWIPESLYGGAFLLVLQLGIYMIYYMAYMRFVYKTAPEGEF